MKRLDFDGLGERETLEKVYAYFKEKYHLGSDKKVNQENLEEGGYNFSHEIDNKILQGIFRTTEDLARSDSDDKIKIKTTVNTHTHGIYLLHSVDEIKKVTGMQSQKVKNILLTQFCPIVKSILSDFSRISGIRFYFTECILFLPLNQFWIDGRDKNTCFR